MAVDNREALLTAARQCLEHPGLSRTTARVVAARARVSPAAIGYHFGTVRALMTAAALDATRAWGSEMVQALEAAQAQSLGEVSRADLWNAVIASFEGHRAGLLATYELLVAAQSDVTVRNILRAQVDHAQVVLARTFEPSRRDQTEDQLRHLGAAHYTILSGLMTQWLLAPESVVSGEVLDAVLGHRGMPQPGPEG